ALLLCGSALPLRLLGGLRPVAGLRLLGGLLVLDGGRGGGRALAATAAAASAPAARLGRVAALGRGGLLRYDRGFGGRRSGSLCRLLLAGRVVATEPAEWQVESPWWARARPSPRYRRRACSERELENMGMSLSEEGSSRLPRRPRGLWGYAAAGLSFARLAFTERR